MKEQRIWVGGVGWKELEEAQRVESSELRERQGRRSQVMTGIQVREGLLGPSRDLWLYSLWQWEATEGF